MNEELETLKDETQLSDKTLLKIINVDYEQHSQFEIDFVKAELVKRGFQLIRTGTNFQVITPQGAELTPDKEPSGALGVSPMASVDTPITPQTDASRDIKMGLNWWRILKYTMLLYVVTFAAGLFFGVVAAFYNRARGNVSEKSYMKILESFPYWLLIVQGLTMTVVIALVFILLSYRERERPLIHVLIVACFGGLMGMPNILMGQPVVQWLATIPYLLILSVICASIGLGLQARKEIAQLKVPPINL